MIHHLADPEGGTEIGFGAIPLDHGWFSENAFGKRWPQCSELSEKDSEASAWPYGRSGHRKLLLRDPTPIGSENEYRYPGRIITTPRFASH